MARRRRRDHGGEPKRSVASVLTLAATAVSLVSGIVGLVFLLDPGRKPEAPSTQRSGTLSLLDVEPRLTRRQYLQRVDLSPADFGFTPEQLDERGAFVEYRYTVIGYKGKDLPVKHELIDAESGDEVSQADTFVIEPLIQEDTGDWHAWVPLPPRKGRFFVLIQLLEPRGVVPLHRLKTPRFEHAAGA